ncbi:MAG: RHS repeat-associated core domain-containing protein [Aliidongia sp.]
MLQFGSGTPIQFQFTDSYVPLGQGGAGQLASVTDGLSGSATNYGYTPMGYLQGLSRGNGAPVYSIQSADGALRSTRVTYGTAAFTNSLGFGTSAGLSDAFYYDIGNRLREADNASTSKTYSYDTATGNITNKSDVGNYSYAAAQGPGPHQLQAVSGAVTASYAYDARGNLATETLPTGQNTYSWTSFDRPLQVLKDGNTVQYYYDTNHNRIAVSTTSASGSPVVKLYLRSAGTYAEATLGSGGQVANMLDYFSSGRAMVGVLSTPFTGSGTGPSQPGTASMAYIHADARGSVTALSDDTGTVLEFDSYDAWGKRRGTDGSDDTSNVITSQTAYGYIDQEQIAGVTNLLNLNARLYNPQIGRFVSADPIGLKGGRNVYAYSGNNPTTNSDPTGLDDGDPGSSDEQITVIADRPITFDVPLDPGGGGGGFGGGPGRVGGRILVHLDRKTQTGSHIVSTRWTTTTGTPLSLISLASTPSPISVVPSAGVGTSSGGDSSNGGLAPVASGSGGLSGGAVDTGTGSPGASTDNGTGGGGGGIQPAVYIPGDNGHAVQGPALYGQDGADVTATGHWVPGNGGFQPAVYVPDIGNFQIFRNLSDLAEIGSNLSKWAQAGIAGK